MNSKFISALVASSVALAGLTAVPASAQVYYGRDGYRQQYQGDGYGYDQDARYQDQLRQREIERYQRQRRAQYQYEQAYARDRYQGYYDDQDPYPAARRGYAERSSARLPVVYSDVRLAGVGVITSRARPV